MSTKNEHDIDNDPLADLYEAQENEAEEAGPEENPFEAQFQNGAYKVGSAEEHEEEKETKDKLEEAKEPEVEDDLPEKYRGKSIQDVIEMHQNAERAMHKKANELNDLEKRLLKGIDTAIDRQLGKDSQDKPIVSMEELLEDPQAAILKVVQSANKQVDSKSEENTPQVSVMTEDDFINKHKDHEAIGKSEEFANWLEAAPARLERLTKALEKNDYDAADELLVSFKEVHPDINAKKKEADTQRKEAEQALSGTRSSRTNSKSGGPKIKESTIIKRMNSDPDWYVTNSAEINRAYEEGRVLMGE